MKKGILANGFSSAQDFAVCLSTIINSVWKFPRGPMHVWTPQRCYLKQEETKDYLFNTEPRTCPSLSTASVLEIL